MQILEDKAMMTQDEFDVFIEIPRTIDKNTYEKYKMLFDCAEQQRRIHIKRVVSQITDGSGPHQAFESYHIEPLGSKSP